MTTHKRLGRLAAGASALALLGAGLIGTAASAEPGPGQDGAPETGSLTLYKKTPVGGDDPTTKTPVVGVTFEACLIDGIDLEDPASWDGLDELDPADVRSEEHTSELQSRFDLVCRLLLEKKKHL